MRYLCCIWLGIVWLVCHAQMRVNGLHIEKAPEIIQRITRQATRYGNTISSGVSGGVSGGSYRPIASSASNYNVRNLDSASALAHQSSVGSNGHRTVGVGAFSFGGMASGRPTNGNSFAINNANVHGKVSGNSVNGAGGIGVIRPQPQANQAIVGKQASQLQQALLQAAQYQYQQKQQYQHIPQHYQQQSQVQQQRRQVAPQQVYRPRPVPKYQQF